MRRLIWLLAVLALAVGGSTAPASVVVYTTSASYTAALGGAPETTQNFNAGPTGLLGTLNYPGFSLTSSPSGYAAVTGGFFSTPGNSIQFSTSPTGTVTFTFAQPTNAFGADFFDVGTVGGTTLSAALNNGAGTANLFGPNFTDTTSGNRLFRGLISTTPFTTLTLSNSQSGDFVEIDNVRFAAAPTPEPATLAAFGALAAAGLGYSRRRLKGARVA